MAARTSRDGHAPPAPNEAADGSRHAGSHRLPVGVGHAVITAMPTILRDRRPCKGGLPERPQVAFLPNGMNIGR
jgi:hypothetical protein